MCPLKLGILLYLAKLGKELARFMSFLGLCSMGLVNRLVPRGPFPWIVGGKSGPPPRWRGATGGAPFVPVGIRAAPWLVPGEKDGMGGGGEVALVPAWPLGRPPFVPGGQGM